MKRMLPKCLLLAAGTTMLSAQGQSDVEQTLLQLEHDWSQADLHKDAAALNRILAVDWIGIDFEGTVLTKAQALKGIASDAASLESTTLRNMKVRIYGDTAIITGTDTEEGEYHGKDSSGSYVWTDVFVRRNGRWQAVSSQSTKLTAAAGAKAIARLGAN